MLPYSSMFLKFSSKFCCTQDTCEYQNEIYTTVLCKKSRKFSSSIIFSQTFLWRGTFETAIETTEQTSHLLLILFFIPCWSGMNFVYLLCLHSISFYGLKESKQQKTGGFTSCEPCCSGKFFLCKWQTNCMIILSELNTLEQKRIVWRLEPERLVQCKGKSRQVIALF